MSMPRPRPKVLTITDAAAARIRTLVDGKPGAYGLRLGIKKGGCAGMEYAISLAEAPGKHDEVVEEKGARVLIEPAAMLYLLGTEIDFKTDKLSSQFVFNNPNQKSACGCGESVSLVPASYERAEAAADG